MNIKGYDVNELAGFAREKIGQRWRELYRDAGLPTEPEHDAWYPLEAFCQVLARLEEMVGADFGTVAREYGHWSAERAARGPHRLLFVFASPLFIIKRANTFWGFYHDFGKIVVVPESDNSARFCLVGCDGLPEIYRYNIAGWTERALMLAGSKDAGVEVLPRQGEEMWFHARW